MTKVVYILCLIVGETNLFSPGSKDMDLQYRLFKGAVPHGRMSERQVTKVTFAGQRSPKLNSMQYEDLAIRRHTMEVNRRRIFVNVSCDRAIRLILF